ncbi:MAG: asparagine synthase-related protein [Acidobacteriota bacterium]
MALIAGYVAQQQQPTEAIRERVRSFSILPGESAAAYEQVVVASQFGHLIVKHKATYPIKPQIGSDAHGNTLAVLGFVLSGDGLLARCARTTARALDECEGQFVAIYAEALTGAVHVVNDRFSSRPFYTIRRHDGTYFSSSVAFLLALSQAPYRPDAIGWLEACTLDHTLGTRTTADGVQRLRPATHLIITPEKVAERQYWRLEHRPDPSLNPASHSAEVFQAFRTSTERRAALVGKGVLALSGGLDSRLVAGALPANVDFSAFTFVDKANTDSTPETRAASAVSAALGLRHHVEALPDGFARPSEVIALTGGMRPYQHMAIVMAYIQEIRRMGAAFLLGGGPGDSLAGAFIPSQAYVDPARTAECIDNAYRRCLGHTRDWSLAFRDDVIEGSRRIVQDAIAESFATVGGPTAAHRITAWAMVYRQAAFTFTSVLHTHPDVTEAASHLDYRYTDLMLQLPASWLYQKAFYSYMIYQGLPQLRGIPYANTGALISGQPPREIPRELPVRRMWDFAQSFGRRAAGRLLRSITPERRRPSLFFKGALLDEVQECIHSIPTLRDIVDVQRCDDLVSRTRAGQCPSEQVLGCLSSLSLSSAILGRN